MSIVPRAISNWWWQRYLRRNATSWDDLQNFPKLRPDQQRKELGERLLRQIRYFGARADALPEWREASRIESVDDLWRIWPDLPIIKKDDLRHRFPAAEMAQRFNLSGQANCTGGSTGEPVHFFHDTQMMKSILAAVTFSAIHMGWTPGMPTIVIWGSERDVKKQTTLRNRIHGKLRNQILVDGYNLSDKTVERVFANLNSGPVAMFGFTSMLEFVARRALETNREVRPGVVRTAWNGGETLFAEQSELFRRVFKVPLLNRYGGRELSVMACQFEPATPLHVLRPWLFAEIVNDQGRPASAGEIGRLLWTSTICRGTPFLRYDVEDLGNFRASDQSESGISGIHELHGRVGGMLTLPGGKKISNLYWNHFFKEIGEVAQFQVILRKDGALQILLRGDGFSPHRETHVRGLLAHFLGATQFQLQWVKSIPRTKEGKLLQVYREV